MKTSEASWKELLEDRLSELEMIQIRGGDGEDDEPDPPIIKNP